MIVATIVFLLLDLLPTDYYFTEDELMKLTDQQKHDRLEAAGLLDPTTEQLFRFYGNVLRLDFGTSRRIQNGVAVTKLIGERFQVSMRLGLIAVGIAVVVGVPIGIIQAQFKNRVPDYIGTAYTIFVNAVPALVAYSLVLVFGSRVLGFPAMYSTRNVARSSVLPIVCLALANIAWWAMWTRRYMVDESTKDYIKLARIKGMSTNSIMFRHVLKNAFVPLAQYLPAALINTISGSLLVERFFSVPGMGPLLTDSIGRYDKNVVLTLVILYSSMSIMGVFLGDVLMLIVDPRISLTSKGGTR